VDCKLCTRQKRCPDKEKPPKNCIRFERLEDSKRFDAVDKAMRHNKGVWIAPG